MDREYDEIDNMFFEYFSNKEIPRVVENHIATAMYRINDNKLNEFIKKVAIVVVSIITVCGGLVFAKDIIKNIFANRQGINTAIENGYILSPNMEYVESNNTKIKINDILVDDYNLNINFSVKTNGNVKDIEDVYFSSMIITDENNNILYCNNKEIFDKFCRENGLDYKYDEFNDGYVNSGLNYYMKDRNIEENSIVITYNLAAYNVFYPRSKNINIWINEIEDNKKEKMKGDWKMKVNVSEKFYNREEVKYKEKNKNDSKINIISAVVYDTELKLQLEIEEENQGELKNINMRKLRDEMQKELEEHNRTEKKIDNLINNEKHYYIGPATEKYMETYERIYEPITNIYIENEKGEKFYQTNNTSEDIITSRDYERKILKYSNEFDITKYKLTDILKIHFVYDKEEKVIEIEIQ